MDELTKEEKELKNAYLREWRANNKDRVKQHKINYWKNRLKKLKGVTEQPTTKGGKQKNVTGKSVTQNGNSNKPVTRVCKICGTGFKSKYNRSLYCSKKCKQRAYRQNKVKTENQ